LERAQDRGPPIGWVLDRLEGAGEVEAASETPIELERGGARFVLSVDRGRTPAVEVTEPEAEEGAQLALFAELPTSAAPRGYTLPELVPPPAAPLHRVR